MVIAKTDSRNIAFKAGVMSQAVLDGASKLCYIELILAINIEN